MPISDVTLFDAPHRRLNILTGEWVLVSPHRARRPWQGAVEPPPVSEPSPAYDPACYLCPGNTRANGRRNPDYTDTFVFVNDFAALLPDTEDQTLDQDGLLVIESERGICRVVCYSPRHDLTMANMEVAAIRRVVDVWAEQYTELASRRWVRSVQIFENRGAMMGASNPHPHGQIWANERIPTEIMKELRQQQRYMATNEHTLLSDYLALELKEQQRIICQNDHFVVLVPFWATWPFETLLVARAPHGALTDLNNAERDALAAILRQLIRCYDHIFDIPFPYSMGFHQRPTDGKDYPEWHLHAHFYPPLLRSATVRKFMVGYEMLCQPQRDITPEVAARHLRMLAAEQGE